MLIIHPYPTLSIIAMLPKLYSPAHQHGHFQVLLITIIIFQEEVKEAPADPGRSVDRRTTLYQPPEGIRGSDVWSATLQPAAVPQSDTRRRHLASERERRERDVHARLEQMHAKRRYYSSCRKVVRRIQMKALIVSLAALLSFVTWTAALTSIWWWDGSPTPPKHHNILYL